MFPGHAGCSLDLCFPGTEIQNRYISKDGQDTSSCRNPEEACSSLHDVINTTQLEAHVFIISALDDPEHVYSDCGIEIFDSNVTIEGLGHNTPSLSCSSNVSIFETYLLEDGLNISFVAAPVLFVVQNSRIKFMNLIFRDGFIVSMNSLIFVSSSQIYNSAFFLMDQTYFVNYLQTPSRLKQVNLINWILRTIGDSKKQQQFCSQIVLSFYEVKFHHKEWNTQKAVPLNELLKSGIQAICFEITMHIEKSYMADRIVYVHSVNKLHANFIGTTFEGTDQGQNIQGGIKLHYLCPPSIRIENSLFVKMKFFSLLYAIFSDQVSILRGAVTLERFVF